MNTPAASAPLGDDAILAAPRPPNLRPMTALAPRRRRWPWRLLALAVLGLVLMLTLLGALGWQHGAAFVGFSGPGDWRVGFGPEGWHGDGGLAGVAAAVLAVLVAVLALAVVLPLLLLGAGLAVGLALALTAVSVVGTLALLLGTAALLAVLLLSPLWLLGLLVWWALKPAAVASSAAA
jgi:hypothetical protein